MANFKKQVGMVNRMGRSHSSLLALDKVKQVKSERIACLIEIVKDRQNGR